MPPLFPHPPSPSSSLRSFPSLSKISTTTIQIFSPIATVVADSDFASRIRREVDAVVKSNLSSVADWADLDFGNEVDAEKTRLSAEEHNLQWSGGGSTRNDRIATTKSFSYSGGSHIVASVSRTTKPAIVSAPIYCCCLLFDPYWRGGCSWLGY